MYGEHVPSQDTCERWLKQFRDGIYDVADAIRGDRPKTSEDKELKELLDEDSCQTQTELAASFNVTQQAISERLKALRMVY